MRLTETVHSSLGLILITSLFVASLYFLAKTAEAQDAAWGAMAYHIDSLIYSVSR